MTPIFSQYKFGLNMACYERVCFYSSLFIHKRSSKSVYLVAQKGKPSNSVTELDLFISYEI